MAININGVYKTVLSILNKEQRGYITPDEFNKISKQVQLALLDQALIKYNQNINSESFSMNAEGYGDLVQGTQEKIDEFYKTSTLTDYSSGVGTLPTDIYKIIDVSISDTNIEQVNKSNWSSVNSTPMLTPTSDFPIYYKTSTQLNILPNTTSNPTLKYIKVPKDPRWGYTINATYGTNIYDDRLYVDGGLIIANNTLTTRTTISSGATNGTYTGTAGTTSGFTGGNATIKVTVAGNAVTQVDVTAAGSGYAVGDTITVASSVIGGSTNLVITLVASNIYNTTTQGSTNFELHKSEEPNLILGVLSYAGVTLKDPAVTQLTTQIAQANEIVKQQ